MTNTSIFVFTQPNCPPCYRLKDYIKTLPSEQQGYIEVVPYRTNDGRVTALAEECEVEATPTLVVANEQMLCDETDEDGVRVCDIAAEPIETIVGGQAIITALPGIISNYVTLPNDT